MRGLTRRAAFVVTNWRPLIVAYLYLVMAGWLIYVRRRNLSPWLQRHEDTRAEQSRTFPERAARHVDIASRYPFRWSRCLQRSLALCLWMDSHGYRPILRIGVRREGRGLDAHAWVEHQGRVLMDTDSVDMAFARLKDRSSQG